MSAYLSAFKVRLKLEFQYRAAALGGLACQVFFGLIYIALYLALYQTRGQAVDVAYIVTYVWLQQACFRMLFSSDTELTQTIVQGAMAYQLTRPISPYFYWYMRAAAQKLMASALRGLPMVALAFLMPAGYRMGAPASLGALILFFTSLFLGLLCVCALDNIAAGFTLNTLDPRGVNALLNLTMLTLSGNILPLTLFPDAWQSALRFSPYTQLLDTPIALYAGQLPQDEILLRLIIQAGWVGVLIGVGYYIWHKNLKRIVVQGG